MCKKSNVDLKNHCLLPLCQSASQPVSQSVSQSIGGSVSQTVSQSISQSIGGSVNQSDSQSVTESLRSQSVTQQPVSRSVIQSISGSVISGSLCHSVIQSDLLFVSLAHYDNIAYILGLHDVDGNVILIFNPRTISDFKKKEQKVILR